jgi:HEAT repeat protein
MMNGTMHRFMAIVAALGIGGCRTDLPPPQVTGAPVGEPVAAHDGQDDASRVEAAIERLTSEHVEDVEEAMTFLRANAELAHDTVLRALSEHRSFQQNLAVLLGEWGRAESVPVLRDAVLRGDHTLRHAASMALAVHAHPSAGEALSELARSEDEAIKRAAGLALADRKKRGGP